MDSKNQTTSDPPPPYTEEQSARYPQEHQDPIYPGQHDPIPTGQLAVYPPGSNPQQPDPQGPYPQNMQPTDARGFAAPSAPPSYPHQSYPPGSNPQQPYPQGPYPQNQPTDDRGFAVPSAPTTMVVVQSGSQCMICGIGHRTGKFRAVAIVFAVFFFPLGLIFCLLSKEYRCSHCGVRM